MAPDDPSVPAPRSQGSLKRRLLAAAVLLPAAILWVLFAPLPVYAGIAALLVFAAAWEWAALAGVTDDAGRAVYLFAALVLMGLGWWVHGDSTLVRGLLIAFALFWVLTAVDLCFPPPVGSASHTARLIQGLLVLAPAWFGFLVLRAEPNGTRLVIAFLAIVWAADASAYFTGRAWGLHRMAPNISPGKSWEGLAGGIVGGAIAGVIASLWCPVPIYTLVPLAVGTTLFSVVGDLAESRLKRAAGAKDSGRLIPGHGGLLDRIDSLCAAAPAFVLGFQLWAAR